MHPEGLDDRQFSDLPSLLRSGDALVFNDTRVIRAALEGERVRGEARARVSFNLHKRVDESRWRAFARPAKRLAVGDRIRFGHDGRVCFLGTLDATVTEIGEAGEVELSFSMHSAYLDQAIEALGDPPLPPYIVDKRGVGPADASRYQTIYARRDGAVAAPTAGLHFTDRVLGSAGRTRDFPAFRHAACRAQARSCRSRPKILRSTACMPSGARFPPRRLEHSTECMQPVGALSPLAPPRCACWSTVRGERRSYPAVCGRDRPVYYPRLSFQGGRFVGDQLPLAAFHVCSCWSQPSPASTR